MFRAATLTAPERETVITFSDADDTATIHTHQRRIITKLLNNPAAKKVEDLTFEGSAGAVFEISGRAHQLPIEPTQAQPITGQGGGGQPQPNAPSRLTAAFRPKQQWTRGRYPLSSGISKQTLVLPSTTYHSLVIASTSCNP